LQQYGYKLFAIGHQRLCSGSVLGVESCKTVFPGGTSYSLVQKLLLLDALFSHNAHCTASQTGRQTDNSMMAIADQLKIESRNKTRKTECLDESNNKTNKK